VSLNPKAAVKSVNGGNGRTNSGTKRYL